MAIGSVKRYGQVRALILHMIPIEVASQDVDEVYWAIIQLTLLRECGDFIIRP